ncbi:MAG: ion transporter [Acidimicrobiales bacterium]
MAPSTTPPPDATDTPPAGEPTSAERLAHWETRTRPLIIAAAVLPLFGAFTTGAPDVVVWVVAFGTWFVFLVDLVVHVRLSPGYLRTKVGWFDLFLVVTTFPWYLVGGGDSAGVTQLFRLARLERVAKVATSSPLVQRFMKRLGRPVVYAAVMLVTCSIIVTRAEGPANGFTDIGAGLWWGIVTLTTVGYGDLVPETTVGRVTASVLMVSGVALLGTVAASLASLFRMEDTAVVPGGADVEDSGAADVTVADLQRQIADLHDELRTVRSLLEARAAGEPS